jgi:protoheme IX farnesyltransferase
MGPAYLVIAAVLGLIFLRYVLRMMRDDTTAARWALYRFSLLYLFLLFVAMMVDRLVFA